MSSGALIVLHADIDDRVASIRDGHPDWPCAKGCASCCHQLANVPQLSEAEWALLREGLAALPAVQLQQIRAGVAALALQTEKPYRCPMLDVPSGACRVYLQRPVACRSYGFYVQRALGLYCDEIRQGVDQGGLDDVVWGNHDAVDQQVRALGVCRPLTDWFERWPG
ncbi:MAG: YkgJ family cysteine cluster protein [Parazoarcus communis]